MKNLGRLVGEFYGTIGVPMIYAFGLFLITKEDYNFGVTWQVIGLFLTLVGILMWVRSYKALGSAFGVLPRAQKRITTGLYKYLKHPMYIGITMTYLGLSLAGGSRKALLFTVLMLVPLLAVRAHYENKLLGD